MTSLFRCPVCGGALTRGERAYTCPGGHSFDIAREGYVHLLPANQMHSKAPGDDKAMAAARSRFLDGGWYAYLRDALTALAVEHAPQAPAARDVTVPGEALADLFQMTPYYYNTPREGMERLAALEGLKLRAGFRIHVLRRQ